MTKLIREVVNEELGLVLRKYTKRVFYRKLWDEHTENARGHVVDLEGRPVATPFAKFFNLGENVKTSRKATIAEIEDLGYQMYRDTKWNGHMSMMYRHAGKLLNHTTGTFDHPFNEEDRRIITETGFNESNIPDGWTLMFEIIGEHDPHLMTTRHMYELGGEKAILLGVNHVSGRAVHRDEYMSHFITHGITDLNVYGHRVSVQYEMWDMGVSASEYLDIILNQKFTEGSILYNPETQWRVKLKTKWFVYNRYVRQFDHKKVAKIWLEYGSSAEAFDKIPEELHDGYHKLCGDYKLYTMYRGDSPKEYSPQTYINETNMSLVDDL